MSLSSGSSGGGGGRSSSKSPIKGPPHDNHGGNDKIGKTSPGLCTKSSSRNSPSPAESRKISASVNTQGNDNRFVCVSSGSVVTSLITPSSSSFRTHLPAKTPKCDATIWSVLKTCIGKDLSKITMPVQFNEPLSFLQRISEHMEYSELLQIHSDDPVERIQVRENNF